MKKWLISLLVASAALAVMLSAASCEKYILPRLESNIDTIQAPVAGGVFDITITSNVRWIMDDLKIDDWINVDVKYGESDYEEVEFPIKVTVQPNETGSKRTCVMTYASATLSRNLVVEQEGSSDTQ